MLKRIGVVALLYLVVLAGGAWGEGFAFRLTPEAAALLKERGSVGYLYWGTYQGCCEVDLSVFVEAGAPDVAENARLGYEKVKGDYLKAENDGFTLYIRSDMKFEGGIPQIDRRDYAGMAYLLVRNALRD